MHIRGTEHRNAKSEQSEHVANEPLDERAKCFGLIRMAVVLIVVVVSIGCFSLSKSFGRVDDRWHSVAGATLVAACGRCPSLYCRCGRVCRRLDLDTTRHEEIVVAEYVRGVDFGRVGHIHAKPLRYFG